MDDKPLDVIEVPAQAEIAEQREYFARAGLWPVGADSLDIAGWLSNFTIGEDRRMARALIDSFLYFSENVTRKLFLSAFHALSGIVEQLGDAKIHSGEKWSEFLTEKVCVSYPTGNSVEITGSGPRFATLVRDNTPIPEKRIVAPDQLVRTINSSASSVPIVLVDDFAGSGTQFIDTWNRKVPTFFSGEQESIASLFERGDISQVFYVVAVSTREAIERINAEVPNVRLVSSYILDSEDTASSPNTQLVPEALRGSLYDFLVRHAKVAGYTEEEALGFGEVGYAIGFQSHIPDNSIPLFRDGRSTAWRPLVRKY